MSSRRNNDNNNETGNILGDGDDVTFLAGDILGHPKLEFNRPINCHRIFGRILRLQIMRWEEKADATH
jgi:hypothetical protein